MDWIVGKIVGFGVPGLVLLIAMGLSGGVGAAAFTTGLAAIGGTMIGGVFVLGLVGVLSQGIARYGFEAILLRTIEQFEREGVSKEEIINRIKSYPLSGDMKRKMVDKVENVGYSYHGTNAIESRAEITLNQESKIVDEVICPLCKQSNPQSYFTCMYCGERLGE